MQGVAQAEPLGPQPQGRVAGPRTQTDPGTPKRVSHSASLVQSEQPKPPAQKLSPLGRTMQEQDAAGVAPQSTTEPVQLSAAAVQMP